MNTYLPEQACPHVVEACNPEDEHTVVDPQLRVKGVKNLRVADASVMPVPMHGNTNHACIMIGAKAADIILGSEGI